jgi:hypothetical protein
MSVTAPLPPIGAAGGVPVITVQGVRNRSVCASATTGSGEKTVWLARMLMFGMHSYLQTCALFCGLRGFVYIPCAKSGRPYRVERKNWFDITGNAYYNSERVFCPAGRQECSAVKVSPGWAFKKVSCHDCETMESIFAYLQCSAPVNICQAGKHFEDAFA